MGGWFFSDRDRRICEICEYLCNADARGPGKIVTRNKGKGAGCLWMERSAWQIVNNVFTTHLEAMALKNRSELSRSPQSKCADRPCDTTSLGSNKSERHKGHSALRIATKGISVSRTAHPASVSVSGNQYCYVQKNVRNTLTHIRSSHNVAYFLTNRTLCFRQTNTKTFDSNQEKDVNGSYRNC